MLQTFKHAIDITKCKKIKLIIYRVNKAGLYSLNTEQEYFYST